MMTTRVLLTVVLGIAVTGEGLADEKPLARPVPRLQLIDPGARKDPIKEFELYPIRDVVADAGRLTLQFRKPGTKDEIEDRTLDFVAVRGLVPLAEQLAYFEKEGWTREQSRQLFQTYDFDVQRQSVSGTKTRPRYGKWQDVDVSVVTKLLDEAPYFEDQDPAPRVSVDPVITMPLPQPAFGYWATLGTHPKLGEEPDATTASKYLLFRYADFDVKPRQQWRYRVRLTVVNPLHQLPPESLADPKLGKEETSRTTWSEPSEPVTVRRSRR